MAAYRLALEERTVICDVALIIVSTPETSQAIFIDGDQLALQESRFIKRAAQFITSQVIMKLKMQSTRAARTRPTRRR